MDFSKEWEDAASCRCSDRLKPLERRKARQHQRCLAHSLVGTPNYIAPEVLLRTGTASPAATQGLGWGQVSVLAEGGVSLTSIAYWVISVPLCSAHIPA